MAALIAVLFGAGCDGCPKVSRCDVRKRDCQHEVMEAVACLRGGGSDELPKVSVISEEEFIEILAAFVAEDPEAQAEAEAAYRLWNRGLSLFALAPADYEVADALADSAGETAAAYLHDTREIVIIDRGGSLDTNGAVELFAHEIVHALQDQELDLDVYSERFATDFDSSLALDAIVEGEAVHYQILAAIELAGRGPNELDWEGFYTDWRSETLRDAETDEAPVALADMRFPYAFGGGFVGQHWLARGRAGIDALFEDPPRTTSEVMFGTSRAELEAEQALLHEHAVPALPEAFVEHTETALGAWIARMYAARANLDVGARLDTSRALAADAFSVHHDEQSDLLVAAWRTRFLEDSLSRTWPGIDGMRYLARTEDASREFILMAGDPQLPADADALAWRAPAEEEPAEDEASALASAWRAARALGRARACPAGRPAW